MVVTKLLGGFGNQIMSFAAGYVISKVKNQEHMLDISDYINGYFRMYMLDYYNLPENTKIAYSENSPYWANGACESFLSSFDMFLTLVRESERKDILTDKVLEAENVLVQGYPSLSWCTPEEIGDIKKVFTLRKPIRFGVFDDIPKEERVCVHIRRGDFLKLDWTSKNIKEYYDYATDYFSKKLNNPVFLIFSDDINWARENIKVEGREVLFVNLPGDDLAEFELLRTGQYFVLTDKSTYGMNACALGEDVREILINEDTDKLKEAYHWLPIKVLAADEYSGFSHGDIAHKLTNSGQELDVNMIEELIMSGREDEAIYMIDSFASTKSFSAETLDVMLDYKGTALLQSGSYGAAFRCFDKISDNCGSPDLLYNLSVCYEMDERQMFSKVFQAAYSRLTGFEMSCEGEREEMLCDVFAKGISCKLVFLVSEHSFDLNFLAHSVAKLLKKLKYDVSIIPLGNSELPQLVGEFTNTVFVTDCWMGAYGAPDGCNLIYADKLSAWDLGKIFFEEENEKYSAIIKQKTSLYLTNDISGKYPKEKCFSFFSKNCEQDKEKLYAYKRPLLMLHRYMNCDDIIYVAADILLVADALSKKEK